jgi:hypothetical protein
MGNRGLFTNAHIGKSKEHLISRGRWATEVAIKAAGKTVDPYDHVTDDWRRRDDLKFARALHTVAVLALISLA